MAPRKQVEDLPGFGQASAPATSPQGVIAFAPRTSPLLELSQSLQGVRRDLDRVFDKRLGEITEEEATAGRIAAMKDDFKSYSDMVASGKIPPSEHPAFFTAYEQQKGRVSGQAYTAFINDKMVNWEGAGSDDMSGGDLVKSMPEWRKEFFQGLGDQSNEFMTGLLSYAENAENNVMSQHIAEARRTAEANMETQVYNEFYNIVGDRDLPEDQLFARIDEVYARQEFIGLRNKVGPLLLEAVTDYAVENGDVGLIEKVEKYTRKDAKTGQSIPVLKNTKAKAALDKARTASARSLVTLDNLRRSQEEQVRKDALRKKAGEAIKGGGNVNPIDFAKAAMADGADPVDALQTGNAIVTISRNGENVFDSRRVDQFFVDMMTKPDPKKGLTEYLKELGEVGGNRSDLAAAESIYGEFVEKGRGLFADNPELAALASSYGTSWDGKVNVAEKEQAMRDIAVAARSILPGSKAKTPSEFAAEVKKAVEARRKERSEAAVRALTETPTDDGGAAALAASPNKSAAAPGDKQSMVALPPVATVAELIALRGKPVDAINQFLASKPLLPPNEMARAQLQIRNGSRGPESEKLRRAMEKAGIDTTDMGKAFLELMKRGQARFLATAPKPAKPK